ncbi:MAG: hypothetical protein ABI255_10955 [Microbacteriaceae bacterium]
MSTLKHPVGPQPSRVYWRRRLIVVLGILAVIAVIVLIIVRPGSGEATPLTSAQTPTPSSTAKPAAPTAPSTTIPTDAATADGAPCKAKDVAVVALTDKDTYGAGENPQLSLSLTNTGAKSCTIDAGTAKQLYTITSGTETYWKSSDCQTDPVDTVVALLPGKTVTSTPIAWDRTRSDPATCNSDRPPVPTAGASYHLKISVDGVASKTTKQFILN